MDASLVLTLVQTLLQLLASPISREIQSAFGYASQLDKLRNTIFTIQAVLVNIENKHRHKLPTTIPAFTLDRLKEALYEADDLFDEIATLAQHKKLSGDNKPSQKVRLFFSCFNQFHYAFTKSREIKKIRERLDAIAKDHRDFGLMQGQVPATLEVGNHSRETHSFVCEEDVIIGRDEDKQRVIDMLVDDTLEEAVSIVSIVGIGGLGKTTLAQSVYNEDLIQREFQLKMWVCVSDDFDVRFLLCKILAEATNETNNSGLSMEQVQRNLRQTLQGKKYLLVLDDVWDENPSKWHEVRKLLIQGGRGSRIIVTTRSLGVANIVGSHKSDKIDELKGLSEKDSWELFKKMTLEPGQHIMEPQFLEIGRDFIRKCANVPLALKVIGSLLRGQGERKWRNLANIDLANIVQDKNSDIVHVLKISYNYLPSCLKSCFSYCAVFPKDHKIMKEDLIHFWMAQGYIIPLNGQSFEDLGEEYFMILLQRCFFQDVKRDDTTGVIVSCKMHDLVHDLAIEVSKSEIKFSSNDISSLDDKTRHIFIDKTTVGTKNVECYITKMKRLRTCLVCHQLNFICFDWLPKMIYLRVLDLSQDCFGQKRDLKNLPSKIGLLVHLRYLDLSHNKELCVLPNSITQLCNLQTLKLYGCKSLQELPRELSKLVNLKHLDIWGCDMLIHMPQRMNKMTGMQKLTMFVLGGSCGVGGLGDLKYLDNLKGKIKIKMGEGWRYGTAQFREGGYLINKPLLNEIIISWNLESIGDDNAEALLQGLQPHPNIKLLMLTDYPGVKFPSWGNGDSLTMKLSYSLPNLVELKLYECSRLKHVPLLSQLRHLKVLSLGRLRKLEYMESKDKSTSSSSGDGAATVSGGTKQAHDELVFFPSLESLTLINLLELKGWWEAASHLDSREGQIEIGDNNHEQLQQQQQQQQQQESSIVAFPSLSHLYIHSCPKLTNFPSLPNLKKLSVDGSEKVLKYFDSLPRESFQHLSSLCIDHDFAIDRLSRMELFQSGRLSSLVSLELRNLMYLEMEDNDEDMPWRCLAPSLHSLRLRGLPKIRGKLPKGMRHLTALRILSIDCCENLEEIPTWISCLTSLRILRICRCSKVKSLPEEMRHLTSLNQLELIDCSPELKERCQQHTGANWHIIQHIPTIHI